MENDGTWARVLGGLQPARESSQRTEALFEVAGVQQTHDESEVQNYVRALELGLDLLKELPISLRLIRPVHARLLTGVRGADMQPGEFRTRHCSFAAYGCWPV